jgi:uncharacterized protein (DUF58 family)
MKRRSGILDEAFIRQLEQLELVVRRLQSGRTHGEKRSKRRGAGSEFADYRDYVQGDDPRFIDWNIAGRLDRLFLKLFHEEEDLRVSIFLDTSRSMEFGDPPKLAYAKKLAAALAYVALANYDRVTIEAVREGGLERFRPARGRPMIWEMLEFLEGISAEGGTDLHRGLKQFAQRQAGPGMRIVVSDFLDKRGAEGALRWLAGGGSPAVLVQVLSPQEVQPAIAGDIAVEDAEDGALVEVSISGRLLRHYAANLNSLVGGLRDYSRARGMAYFFAQTSHPIETLLLSAFRRAGILR